MARRRPLIEASAMSEHITEQQAVRRLERSRSDRMLAGVCGGLARYFELSPILYRVGFVVLTLLGGAGLLIYAAAILVIPDEGKDDSIAADILRTRRDRPVPLIALGIVIVAGATLLSRATLWPHGDLAWVLLLVGGAVLLWTHRRSASPPAADAAAGPGSADEAPTAPRPRRRLLRNAAIVSAVLLLLTLC